MFMVVLSNSHTVLHKHAAAEGPRMHRHMERNFTLQCMSYNRVVKRTGSRQNTWVQILALPLNSSVVSDKLINLFVPHLLNGNNESNNPTGLLCRLNETIHIKHTEHCLAYNKSQ